MFLESNLDLTSKLDSRSASELKTTLYDETSLSLSPDIQDKKFALELRPDIIFPLEATEEQTVRQKLFVVKREKQQPQFT